MQGAEAEEVMEGVEGVEGVEVEGEWGQGEVAQCVSCHFPPSSGFRPSACSSCCSRGRSASGSSSAYSCSEVE